MNAQRPQTSDGLSAEQAFICDALNAESCAIDSIISQIRDNHEQATVHAEQNSICDCAKRGVSCEGATAYITHYPCIICTRLLLASGIKHIKYLEDYKNDDLVKIFTNELSVKIEQLI